MKKEDLMKIEGMTDALATQIAEQSAEELKNFIPKARFDEVNEAKKNAESLVKERDKQLEDVKKSTGDNEELKKQIEDLQTANKTAKAQHEAEIKQTRIDNAVTLALTTCGAKNSAAVKALLKDLDKVELADDGTVKGLKEQIEAIQKSDSYLFNTGTEPAKPAGVTPASGVPAGGTNTVTAEQFAKMGYKQRLELFNTNKELYDTLTGATAE